MHDILTEYISNIYILKFQILPVFPVLYSILILEWHDFLYWFELIMTVYIFSHVACRGHYDSYAIYWYPTFRNLRQECISQHDHG